MNIPYNIHLVGHAHIDPVWFWRWQEGFAEVKATFRSALDRITEFPGFIYTSSCAAYYKWVEESDPAMFAEVQRRVAEGRWHIAGGMWIQPDCNIPSGESFCRHLLLSQRYFTEKFGVCATTGFNVDSFGHNAALPKILSAAGMNNYVMMRPSSLENPEMPSGAFWWEPDGENRILAFRIDEQTGYNGGSGDCDLNDNYENWPVYKLIKRYAEESARLDIPLMCLYGVGNHGGGPTIKILKQINALQKMPGGEKLIFSNPEMYFKEIRERRHGGNCYGDMIPVRKTDLQWHASGCYSAMSEIKMNNRKAENRLIQAEKFSVLADFLTGFKPRADMLGKAWQGVLFNQFHDIMCGCSAREAYDDARELHGQALSIASEASNNAVQAISWNIDTSRGAAPLRRSKETDWSFWELDNLGTPIVVFNPLSWKRKIPVQIGRMVKSVCGDDGAAIPVQTVRASRSNREDKWDALFIADVPAMGYAVYWAYLNTGQGVRADNNGADAGDARAGHIRADDHGDADDYGDAGDHSDRGAYIENNYLRLEIDGATGFIQSMYDKTNGREVFSAAAAVPIVIDIEHADTWGHNVFSFRNKCGEFGEAEVSVLETGPVRAKLRVKSKYNGSVLIQDFMLYGHSREVLADVWLDCREKHKMIKLSFPVDVYDGYAEYDIPFGSIKRPAGGTEESGQMWFDVSGERDGKTYGLAVLNNSKYSYDVLENDMRMTIANTSIFADHYAGEYRDGFCEYLDQGIQRFKYSLYPHGGRDENIVKSAYALNTEETHVNETYHTGRLPLRNGGIVISAENIIATSFKRAYDGGGYALRLCEYGGRDARCEVGIPSMNVKFTVDMKKNTIRTFYIPENSQDPIHECDLYEQIHL